MNDYTQQHVELASQYNIPYWLVWNLTTRGEENRVETMVAAMNLLNNEQLAVFTRIAQWWYPFMGREARRTFALMRETAEKTTGQKIGDSPSIRELGGFNSRWSAPYWGDMHALGWEDFRPRTFETIESLQAQQTLGQYGENNMSMDESGGQMYGPSQEGGGYPDPFGGQGGQQWNNPGGSPFDVPEPGSGQGSFFPGGQQQPGGGGMSSQDWANLIKTGGQTAAEIAKAVAVANAAAAAAGQQPGMYPGYPGYPGAGQQPGMFPNEYYQGGAGAESFLQPGMPGYNQPQYVGQPNCQPNTGVGLVPCVPVAGTGVTDPRTGIGCQNGTGGTTGVTCIPTTTSTLTTGITGLGCQLGTGGTTGKLCIPTATDNTWLWVLGGLALAAVIALVIMYSK